LFTSILYMYRSINSDASFSLYSMPRVIEEEETSYSSCFMGSYSVGPGLAFTLSSSTERLDEFFLMESCIYSLCWMNWMASWSNSNLRRSSSFSISSKILASHSIGWKPDWKSNLWTENRR
jgi:hypothetical protein